MTGARACVAVGAITVLLAIQAGVRAQEPHPSGPAQPDETALGFHLLRQVGGLASAVEVRDDRAYLLCSGRLIVFDASTAAQLPILAETEVVAPFGTQMVAVGTYLYLVEPGTGLHVFDVSSDAPREVTFYELESVQRLTVDGTRAYVAAGEDGVQILDIADKGNPRLLGAIPTTRASRDTLVVSGYLYIAERDRWESAVRVVDVSDPGQPIDVGFEYTPGGADFLAQDASHVYVLGATGGFWVLWKDDPTSPRRWGYRAIYGESTTPGIPATGPDVHEIVLANEYAYIAASTRGIVVVDVSFGGNPNVVTTIDTPGEARSIALKDRQPYGYVADWHHGMRVFDLEEPKSAREIVAYDTPGDVVDVASVEGLLCLGDQSAGVRVGEATDPTDPRLVGFQAKSGQYVRRVAAYRHDPPSVTAYCVVAQQPIYRRRKVGDEWITEYVGGLQLVDVHEPHRPRELATLDELYMSAATVADDVLYAASQQGGWRPPIPRAEEAPPEPQEEPHPFNGLLVADVSRPSSPNVTARLELDGLPQDVAVSGSRAYLATDAAGLQIVDVTDKLRPAATGRLTDTYGNAKAVEATDSTAYVAVAAPASYRTPEPGAMEGALSVVDVSDPQAPAEIGRLKFAIRASDIALAKDHVVVVDREGLTLVDVTDPARPLWRDRFVPSEADPSLSPEVISVDVQGSIVYVGVDPATLFVLELAEGPLPTPSPGPTNTPTASPMPSSTPLPSASPTSEPPLGIYLPIARKN